MSTPTPTQSPTPTESPDLKKARTAWRLYSALATVLFLVGIGGFGTASSGEVTMFGLTIEAKYACFAYFVLGGLFVWSALEAKKRGGRW